MIKIAHHRRGERPIWLEDAMVDRLGAMRRQVEEGLNFKIEEG